MKKGIVIAAIFILFVIGAAFAEETADGNVVVVGTNTQEKAGVAADEPSVEPAAETKPADQAICTPGNNILTRAGAGLKSAGVWVISRDYKSTAAGVWRWLVGLSIGWKIIIVLALLILIFLIWNYNFRDTRANNMKKAMRHHLKGEEAHLRGDEEKAREHYEKARNYRERAQDQW